MKRWITLGLFSILLLSVSPAQAYTISGGVQRAGSATVVTEAFVVLHDSDGNEIGQVHLPDIASPPYPGYYEFTGLNPGNYHLQAIPYGGGADQFFSVGYMDVEIVDSDLTFQNFILNPGGIISGQISFEVDPTAAKWEGVGVEVYDESGENVGWGHIDYDSTTYPGTGPYSYTTVALPQGTYYVKFQDYTSPEQQFQPEWYGNFPEWRGQGDAVTVTVDEITNGIDATLHPLTVSHERYFINEFNVWTIHRNVASTPYTESIADMQLVRFSEGYTVPANNDISSVEIIPPSGAPCTTPTFHNKPIVSRTIDDDLSTIDDLGMSGYFSSGFSCLLDTTAHPEGTYSATVNFNQGNGGQPLTKTTYNSAALGNTEVAPTNLFRVGWDPDVPELLFFIEEMGYDPNFVDNIQIRVWPFKNGQRIGTRIRVRNLPITIGTESGSWTPAYTLGSRFVDMINHEGVDQIEVQLHTYGINNTKGFFSKTFDFDYTQSGPLTEAPIRMTLFDVDGDGQMGLEETIHTLQVITSP